MTNTQGKVVVEVEKAYKDLHVLYQSMRVSKFFKLCIPAHGDLPEDLPAEVES